MKTKAHHHWFLLAVALVIAYHYRVQLVALWHSIAPRLAALLPPSVVAGITPVTVSTKPLLVPRSPFGPEGNPNLNLKPSDPGGIKTVGGDTSGNPNVGRDVLDFFRSLGGIDFGGFGGGGNPNPQGGTGGPLGGGPEKFV
jgi:hypothetical protein